MYLLVFRIHENNVTTARLTVAPRLTNSRLGENPTFLLILYQFLVDRFKESDYTGSLVASILEVEYTDNPKPAFSH